MPICNRITVVFPMAQTHDETLAKSPIGSELAREECETLAPVMKHRTLSDGEILFREGDTDDTLYIVAAGRLEVTRDVGGGDHVTLHVLKPGDLAGEMAFVDGHPHSATLRALGDAEVMELHRADLERLIESHPWIVYKVMKAIIRSVHGTLMRMNQQYVEMTNYISRAHGRY